MADTDGPDDDAELEQMIARLRPHPAVTALKVTAVIASLLAAFALIFYQTLRSTPSYTLVPPDAATEDGGNPFTVMPLVDLEIRFDRDLRRVAEQTVTVRAIAPGGDGTTFGSGFLVADGIIVSAAHVVPAAQDDISFPVLVFCDGREVAAGISVYDELRDVMVIEAPECRAETLVLDERRLSVDDPLHIAGFMFAAEINLAYRFHKYTSAIPTAVLGERDVNAEADLVRRVRDMRRAGVPRYRAVTGAAIPGNSGSPVFDEQGRIVGMLVIRDTRHDRSYMVPARTILWVLRAHGILPCPL